MGALRPRVYAALDAVRHPATGESIVAMGMVQRLQVTGDQVRVELVPLAAENDLPADFLSAVQQAALAVPGVAAAQVGLHGPDLLTPGGGTRVIGVVSGKGGVGKSTVSAHLAVALHRLGYQVGVLDADIYGYSIPRLLAAGGRPAVLAERVVPVGVQGIKVMSIGLLVPGNEAVVLRGPMLHRSFEQFLTEVAWADPDFLLVDLPPGTGDLALTFMQSVPGAEILIVTTPQATAHEVAVRVGFMAQQVNAPILGVVENMSHVACPECGATVPLFRGNGGEAVATALAVPLLGRVPLDPFLAAEDGPVPPARRDDSPLQPVWDGIAARILARPVRMELPVL